MTPSSSSSRGRTLISDGVTTVFNTLTPASRREEEPVVTRSRIFVSQDVVEEDTSDDGFPGVAIVTELPRFNLERDAASSSSPADEEEEDVVSSEAFR